MKTPCYTTKTGIKIGSAYQPPLRSLTDSEILIQSALLGERRGSPTLTKIIGICLTIVIGFLWVTKH